MKQLISIGDLIDQSWNKYRNAFPFFLQLSGWLVIIALLNTISILLYPSAGVIAYHTSFTTAEIIGVILYGLNTIIITPLLGLWVFVALAIGAYAVVKKTNLTVVQVIKETNKRFLPTLVVVALVGLTILFAQILTIGPSIIIGTIGYFLKNAWILGVANIILFIGLLISVILTARWTLYYVMAPYASAFDHAKNKQALQKSRNMIEGKFWTVFFRLLMPKIVFILFGILCALLLNTVIHSILIGSTGINLDVQQRIIDLVNSILPTLLMIFLNPLIFLSDVILYQNLSEQE